MQKTKINIPVKTVDGWKIDTLDVKPAFELFNESFVYHKTETGWYQLSHFKTGLTLGTTGKATKLKDAIKKATEYMQNIGQDEFLEVIGDYKTVNI